MVATFTRIGLLNFMQYRAEFFMAVGNAVIILASQLLALAVIFAQTPSLAGWTAPGLLGLMGVYFLLSGFIGVIIQPSLERLMEGIRLGTFDFTLLKPADSQLLASIQVVSPARTIDFAIGAGSIVVASSRMSSPLSPAQWCGFVLALLFSVVVVYSFLMILGTCAFWFVKLDNMLRIFSAIFGHAGKWPTTIYPAWLRLALTFLVPVGLAVTVPAEVLAKGVDVGTVGLLAAVSIALLILSRGFWMVGIRHYTGASA